MKDNEVLDCYRPASWAGNFRAKRTIIPYQNAKNMTIMHVSELEVTTNAIISKQDIKDPRYMVLALCE